MLIPLFALIGSTQAFFRLPCTNTLVSERVDTIVAPGKVAGHAHTIFGASNFALTSDFATNRASECSSCAAKADLSNYWTPGLFFQWANGSFTSVPTSGGGMNVYYLSRKNKKNETIVPFPDGLKMLAGSTTLRSYNSSNVMAQNIRWNCTGLPGTQPPTLEAKFKTPGFPLQDCPSGLRSMVVFPSCWDGKNLDSTTHNTHVSYPLTGGENGPCPVGYPVRIPTLRFETTYNTKPYNTTWDLAMNKTQPFVLSNGDGTGFGFHADFFNGWDSKILQKVIDTCTDAGMSNIANCTVLEIFNKTTDGTCRKTPDVNEIVTGTLATLPGCNSVTYAPFTASTCPLPSPPFFNVTSVYRGNIAPPGSNVLSNTPQVVVSYGKWKYTQCATYEAGVRPLMNMLKVNETTMSVENCLNFATTLGYQYAGLANSNQCWGGDVIGNLTDVGYSKCTVPCKGSPLEICGSWGRVVDMYKFMGTPIKPVVVSSPTKPPPATTKAPGANVTPPPTSTKPPTTTKMVTSTSTKK